VRDTEARGQDSMTTKSMGATMRRITLVLALAATVACTPIIRNHGYIPVPEDLERIVIGQDTRESVIAIAGQPTSEGVLEGSDMYYVASKFRHFGAMAPREIDRQVLAISFDANGTVRNIERFTLDDGRVVVLSRRVTDDGIKDTTFLRQLLGNVGRVNASDFLGEN